MVNYYRHNGGYIAVTDQSPAGFEGMVFVGRGGPIDNIQDMLFTSSDLTDPVNVADVPPSWCAALDYHKVEDFPLLDESGENLVAEIPVRTPVEDTIPCIQKPRRKLTAAIFGNKNIAWQIGLVLGVILGIIFWNLG